MKVSIKGKYNPLITFLVNYILFSFIWEGIEMWLHGQTFPSTEDAIMLFLFCLYISLSYLEFNKNELMEKTKENNENKGED